MGTKYIPPDTYDLLLNDDSFDCTGVCVCAIKYDIIQGQIIISRLFRNTPEGWNGFYMGSN